MKYLAIFALFALTLGCKAQQPTQNILGCPPAGSGYTALNATSYASGTTYTDTPTGGNWCYFAQSIVTNTTQIPPPTSSASNIVMATTTTGQSVNLGWTALPTGYQVELWRAPATSTPVTAPSLTGAAQTASVSQQGPVLNAKVEKAR